MMEVSRLGFGVEVGEGGGDHPPEFEPIDPSEARGLVDPRLPRGLGREIGLLPSVPAVRVWGCMRFERAFSGNELTGINEVITDLEPFLVEREGGGYELDARARMRATKFNHVREGFFRGSIRRIMGPFLEAASRGWGGEEVEPYLRVIEEAAEGLPTEAHRGMFPRLVLKMATCSPYDPCGACPACIAEGAAASTARTEGSLPINWEKKYKETDFKTFFTVRSAALGEGVPAAGQILEAGLLERLVRNRVPRPGTTEVAESKEIMFFVENMFKGPGYFKTTVFNPTKLELAVLAYEHLVRDVRRGAKTSSGAGVWDHCRRNGAPMIAVDEILGVGGYLVSPPPPSVPPEVSTPEEGYEACYLGVVPGDGTSGVFVARDRDGRPLIVRYVGDDAVRRLEEYLTWLGPLDPAVEPGLEGFRDLVEYAAAVMSYLYRPRLAAEAARSGSAGSAEGGGAGGRPARGRRRGRRGG